MVQTYCDTVVLSQTLADRIYQHPLFRSLFDCLQSANRSDSDTRLLNAVRLLYFSYSAHYPEAQLIGAVGCIDACLSTTRQEQTTLKTKFARLEGRQFKPGRLVTALFGMQRLENISEISANEFERDRIPNVIQRRNDVVHNGASCTDVDACNAFRLAVRVLLSVANSRQHYPTRIVVVAELIRRHDECNETGGALEQDVTLVYPWFDNGMPDFLPFLLSSYFAPGDSRAKSPTAVSVSKACAAIEMLRRSERDHIIRAIVQSDFFSELQVEQADVKRTMSSLVGDGKGVQSIQTLIGDLRAQSALSWN